MPIHEGTQIRPEPGHPAPHQLECFMRGGGLRGEEVQAIIRHLLTECPRCVAITQKLWRLGERAPGLEVVLEEMAAGGGPMHDEPGLIRRRER